MEKNKRQFKLVIIVLISALVFTECTSNKVISENTKKSTITTDTLLVNQFIQEMNEFEFEQCKINWKFPPVVNIVNLIHTNSDELWCLRNYARKGNKIAENGIFCLLMNFFVGGCWKIRSFFVFLAFVIL